MLFLGAGASKPLGVPTMQEFTEDVIRTLPKQYVPKIKDIQHDSKGFGFRSDIEAVLTALQAKSNPMKAMQDIGAVATAFAGISVGSGDEDAPRVVEEIEKAIRARCEKVDLQKASQFYNLLWDTLFRDPIMFQKGPVYASQGFLLSQIFTTNYDLAFESFLRKRRIPFSDGFEPDSVNDFVFTGQWKVGTAFWSST